MARKPTAKQQLEINRKRVDRAYNSTCHGVQVSIMDLGKIMDHGLEVIKANPAISDDDLGAAVSAFVGTIRKN